MCGIAGIINFDGKPVEEKKIKGMVNVICHRGPDDMGYYFDTFIGLGHCRLSIIDLSEAGHQPMISENGSLVIVYNGEIYNYLEIKRELQKIGYRFKSNSDTEIILYAYKEWGAKCLEKFNGDWAFAIWDKKKKELFCSRDRFGVKPFYYFYNGKTFVFASEIKALLEIGIWKELNKVLIYDFLKFGILDHTDETFFKNIKKLPAASWLKIKENGEIEIKKYWDFEVSSQIKNTKSDKEYAQEFLELFIDSIKLRLRSDVPIGSCFSGGLDSSSIVCLVNEILKKEGISSVGVIQKTFSAVYEDKDIDEREYIEEVVKKTRIEKNYVFPKPQDFLKEIDKILWHQEEPFVSTSIFAQWEVFKIAKDKVKVLLDGQGGDENFCGYHKFYFFYFQKLLKEKKYLLFLNEFFKFFLSSQTLKTIDFKNGLKYFPFFKKNFNSEKFFNPSFFKKFQKRNLFLELGDDFGKRIKEDITKLSLPALLRYEDKNSMAFGIEARLPFLDYRLVEKISNFPLEQKMRNGTTKIILRNALKDIFPEKIKKRKGKIGFQTPQKKWLKNFLFDEIKSTIEKSVFLPSYLDVKLVLKELEKLKRSFNILNENFIFRSYILEKWAKKFILEFKKNL